MTENTRKILSQSGSVGMYILQNDWSDTSIGPIESWPQSLFTALEGILQSKFPMQLCWEKELVSFYNDAYIPFLEEKNKNHSSLGLPAKKLLNAKKVEIIQQVYSDGQLVWLEDEAIAIFLNKKSQTSYWNSIFSPVTNESGKIGGVWITHKSVSKNTTVQKKLENQSQFHDMIMKSPIPMTIFRGEDHIIEFANRAMFEKIWRKKEKDVLGKKALEVFPELNDQKYPELLKKVLSSGIAHKESESLAYVAGDNGTQKFYLDFEYLPLLETDGKASGIMITVNDVTEKVEARKTITDGEERLRLATEAAELATWDLDLKTRDIIHSPRLAEIFGHPKSKKLKHHEMRDQIHPEDIHTIVEASFDKALETGIYKYESRVIKPNNEISWIRTQGKVFYDENNFPYKMIGTLRDITEEKQHQQVLMDSEQKFRLLANSMPQFVWTSDPEGNLNYFNDSVYDYSGLSQQQMNNGGWLQMVHPDDRNENVKRWMSSVNSGSEFIFEHRFRRKDGEYQWQLSRAIPQKDYNGTIQMWVGTSTDIQDHKIFTQELEKLVEERTKELQELNKELFKNEERYHLMVNEIQDYAIIYLNIDGTIENWNRGAEKIKGYQESEIIGKNFSLFYTPEDRKNNLPKKILKEARTQGKSRQEGWRVRKDGTHFWANILVNSISDDKNEIIGFSKVTHDLTEKKLADEKLRLNASQLEQKNMELEKMNAELQSFAYISSHDLQEPLRKIQTFASRLLDKEYQNLSENARIYFSRMQEAANRMQVLIQDLLAYSRTNTKEKEFVDTRLGDIVEDVKNEYREILEEKNGTIDASIMCNARIIPFQFRQLIDNLIGNAIKFSKPEHPPHIKIKSVIMKGDEIDNPLLDKETVYCHIQVSDNGIGFEPQYKERIFEVFQRLHGKEDYSGTGIGLAIVKKIIENHNGFITASSELHKGATFDIYIPNL